jgi:hypothetical protein
MSWYYYSFIVYRLEYPKKSSFTLTFFNINKKILNFLFESHSTHRPHPQHSNFYLFFILIYFNFNLFLKSTINVFSKLFLCPAKFVLEYFQNKNKYKRKNIHHHYYYFKYLLFNLNPNRKIAINFDF